MPLPRAHRKRLERRALYKEILNVAALALGVLTALGFIITAAQLIARM